MSLSSSRESSRWKSGREASQVDTSEVFKWARPRKRPTYPRLQYVCVSKYSPSPSGPPLLGLVHFREGPEPPAFCIRAFSNLPYIQALCSLTPASAIFFPKTLRYLGLEREEESSPSSAQILAAAAVAAPPVRAGVEVLPWNLP